MSKRRKLPRGIDRHRGQYRSRLAVDGQQYTIGTYDHLTDARAAIDIARSQKVRGTFTPPLERRRQLKALRAAGEREALTVGQWAETWLEALRTDPDRPRSPGTLATYRSAIEVHALPVIGDLNLTDVTPEDIDWILRAARGTGTERTAGAGYNVARTLRAMFGAAVRAKAGGIEASPVTVTTSKPTAPDLDAEDRTATPTQVRALAAAMPEHLGIAVQLGAWAALRLGEVLGLQRGDFRHLDMPGEAVVYVRRQWNTKASPPAYTPPKYGSGRRVELPDELAAAVTAHLVKFTGPEDDAPLLPSPRDDHRPMSQTTFDREWRTARNHVKPGMRFHDLRHTGLTAWAQTGATLKEIMQRGGHTDAATAMRYQEAARSRARELTTKLGTMMGES